MSGASPRFEPRHVLYESNDGTQRSRIRPYVRALAAVPKTSLPGPALPLPIERVHKLHATSGNYLGRPPCSATTRGQIGVEIHFKTLILVFSQHQRGKLKKGGSGRPGDRNNLWISVSEAGSSEPATSHAKNTRVPGRAAEGIRH